MTWFFGSGVAFALIAAGMLLEALALFVMFQLTGRGIRPNLLLGDIGAGICLLLAAVAVLRLASWPYVALALLCALAAHLFDLAQRWRR